MPQHNYNLRAAIFCGCLLLASCGNSDKTRSADHGEPYPEAPFPISEALVDRSDKAPAKTAPPPGQRRQAYFGDLHVHTGYSLDAFIFGATASPRDAYRYARGEALTHPFGFEIQLRQPLDFYAVTDHAMFLGLAQAAGDTRSEFGKTSIAGPLSGLNDTGYSTSPLATFKRQGLFGSWVEDLLDGWQDGSLDKDLTRSVTRSAWQDTIDAADEAYVPGEFTTFAAFEYTSTDPNRGSLHRNVIFSGTALVPEEPFSRYHGRDPQTLWSWLDGLRDRGVEALAIPHNSNLSNGQMFALEDFSGEALDADYSAQRARNEPLVEITQVKGTSETHPSLSDTDEWADFEIASESIHARTDGRQQGSYVRQALKDGIALQSAGQGNPFKYGFVAASDTHVAATTDDESNYFSKAGLMDGTPELRGSTPLPWWQGPAMKMIAPKFVAEIDGQNYSQTPARKFSASGLAAVWAEENTREAIYQAFRRKETFATSGPRIQVRMFAGRDFDGSMLEWKTGRHPAYDKGVPMGSDISAEGEEPLQFLVQAQADPVGAPLQRLQIVKGWVDGGESKEKVFDIACSAGQPDAAHRCPDNGARVDIETCAITADVGSSALNALWQDPEFDPGQRAFYYARVLENPTCRWSTWDALRAGVPPRADLPKTLQERAWSSPVWVEPSLTANETVPPDQG